MPPERKMDHGIEIPTIPLSPISPPQEHDREKREDESGEVVI